MRFARLLAPEVIQSSGMDCGPAALKTFLAWFGVHVSYDRLRELCQTSVDGTSIDVLEGLANRLGVDSHQQMLPQDALMESVSELTPCLLVTRLSGGVPHFVVIWSKIANQVQMMNPGVGRRWVSLQRLEKDLYIHRHEVRGQDWLEVIEQGPFMAWFERRLSQLGMKGKAGPYLAGLLQRHGWRGLAVADAAARMVWWLVASKNIQRGPGAVRLFEHCMDIGWQELETGRTTIPPSYWFARPSRSDPEMVTLQGTVLLVPSRAARGGALTRPQKMPAALLRLQQRSETLWTALRQLLRPRDLGEVVTLAAAMVLSAVGALAELMIFRASSSLIQRLGVTHQRLAAVTVFAVFLATLLGLDYLITSTSQVLGRQLEGRLRLSLLFKVPRLPDSYFRSRLLSDMAQRSHNIQVLRAIPLWTQLLLRSALDLAVTVAAISLLQPRLALLTVAGAAASVGIPLLVSRWLFELEDRVQSQQGALSAFYLDALAGLVPLRTHGAEPSLMGEHQKLLVDWFHSTSERQRALTWLTLSQLLCGASLSIALVTWYVRQGLDPQGLLLLLFWTQRIPVLGQTLVMTTSALAPIRSSVLRITEPLRNEDDTLGESKVSASGDPLPSGVHLAFERVRVVAGGHPILSDVNLQIGAGEHVAIVGQSGAGKSSLIGLLLGIHLPAGGKILLDGEALPPHELFARLMPVTAWVDPTVQLWNESLLANIQFGAQDQPQRPIAQVVNQAELLEVLDRLPEGFQTPLGEGGALVSGGEGQRVRFARAMSRLGTRLVLLDEPFRGLDRKRRRLLLERARSLWSTATILCITHDVAETQQFDRVLVVHEGRIAEDGPPEQLMNSPTHYRQLFEADVRAASAVWAADHWRRIRVQDGRIVEGSGGGPS